MKIGILTLVPYDNYGGILQGFALQTVLTRLGHDVSVMNTKLYNYLPIQSKLKNSVLWLIRRYILRKKGISCVNPLLYLDYRAKLIKPFIKKNVNLTRKFFSKKDLENFIISNHYDAFVVGSDQTWRPSLSPDLYHMFCDFIPQESPIKRISYAASFGVDKIEFSQKQLNICKPLLQRFNMVSVRENSGVRICKDYFDVNATQVLDPTMLLDKEDYLHLIEGYVPFNRKIDLMQYVFFFNDDERNVIKKVSDILGKEPVNLMTQRFLSQVYKREQLKEAQFMPVEEWIYGYSNAKFVITDSFHGTVFCIIFNVPFICVSPVAVTRFKSLLSTYGLENRLVMSAKDVTENLVLSKIDWNRVNEIRQKLKIKSIEFLEEALS